jgi:hypothetical protein
LSRQAGGSGSGQAAGVDRTVPPGSDAPAEAPPAAAQGSLAARRRAAAQNLGIYLTFLRRNGDGPLEIALQLFDLHATQRSILPVSADLEQPVEFVQISADTRTLLNLDRYSAASKLTGLQLHHFGAFYKASWRVNDWMWGRLDGAGWLVHLLLDPRRIQLKAQERADPGTVGASEWFIRLLSDPDLAGPCPDEGYLLPAFTAAHSDERQPVLRLEHIRDELEYLDDPSKPTPVSLPLTALWVSRAWQESIAAEELPVLAATVLAGPGATAATVRASAAATVRDSTAATARRSTVFTAVSAAVHSWQSGSGWKSLRLVLAGAKWAEMSDEAHSVTPSSARWANEVTRLHVDPATPLSMIAAKLASCPVPSETFKSEVGSALLTRTTTHSAATAVAAVATVRQLPTVVRPILASLRTVTLTGFRATTLVDPRPRRLAFVGAIAILLGVAAASQQSMLFGLGGLLVAGVGAYLVAIAAWGASRMLLISMLSILLLGGIASLAVFSVRRYLFGTSGQNGVIGRHLHWAADAWWHPFLLLGVGLLVIALLGIAFDPVGRRRKAARTPPRQATGSGTRGR